MKRNLSRFMLCAPRSGGGKTTLTCGLLQLLKNRGMIPAAFKCGPDYIDPLFHRTIVGAKSRNLDLFFTESEIVRGLMAKGSEECDIAVVEGVMGFYDGISGMSTKASSYELARETQTPVILVLESRGASLSLAATVRGFAEFRPDANIQGIILNQCSEKLFRFLAPGLEENTGIPVLGYLPDDEIYTVSSRHLGLVTAMEIDDLKMKMQKLAITLETTLDVDRLLQISAMAPPLVYQPVIYKKVTHNKPRLAVAKDNAFCFYYEENLEILEEMGAELVPFSPMYDKALPTDIQGLYLGGGYPELYAEQLSHNIEMRMAIQNAISRGLPTIAECGGFLYLQEFLHDDCNREWPMVGVLEGKSENTGGLKRFGYITLTAETDNLYGQVGKSIRGHEFHYWNSESNGEDFLARKPKSDVHWRCMKATKNMVAGFPHLYYPSNPDFVSNFIKAMVMYKQTV